MKLEDIKAGMQVHTVVDGKLKKVTAVVKNGVPGHEVHPPGSLYLRQFHPFTASPAYSEDELPAARKTMAAKRKAEREAENDRAARKVRADAVADALGGFGVGSPFSLEGKPDVSWSALVRCELTLEQAETLLAALESAKAAP